MSSDRKDAPVGGNQGQGDNPANPLVTQEKTSLGGDFNSGVTSRNDSEKDEIEKKGGMANIDQRTEEERVTQGGGD